MSLSLTGLSEQGANNHRGPGVYPSWSSAIALIQQGDREDVETDNRHDYLAVDALPIGTMDRNAYRIVIFICMF